MEENGSGLGVRRLVMQRRSKRRAQCEEEGPGFLGTPALPFALPRFSASYEVSFESYEMYDPPRPGAHVAVHVFEGSGNALAPRE